MEKLVNEDKILSGLSNLDISYYSSNKKPIVNEEIIEEGIRYFKNSPKLFKVAEKLKLSSQAVEDEKQKQQLLKASAKLNTLAQKFKKVEDEYKNGNKTTAKKDYNELLKDYKEIGTMLKKEDMKSALKVGNSLAITIASMVVSYFAIANIGNLIGLTKGLAGVDATTTITGVDEKSAGFLYATRIGAAFLARLPINIIGNKTTKAIEDVNNQEQVMNYVKKTFPELR